MSSPYFLLPCSHTQDSFSTHTCAHVQTLDFWCILELLINTVPLLQMPQAVCVVLSGANFNLTRKNPRNPHRDSAAWIFNGTPPHCTSAVLPPGCSATFTKRKQKNLPLQQKCPFPQKPRGTYHRHLMKAPLALFSARLLLVLPSPTHPLRSDTCTLLRCACTETATFPDPCGVGHPSYFCNNTR